MNGMFSNNRGLKDLDKHLHIADCITEHCLDFVGISETGKRDYTGSLLNRISGGVDFSWFSCPPWGRLGVYITWRQDGYHGSVGLFGRRFPY
jgi:hypothetical protein